MRTSHGFLRSLGGAAIAVAAMALVPSIAAGFCDTKVVHDYTSSLRKMPPLRGVPANHDLPFGPAGLYLFKGSQLPVMVPIGAPGAVGFAITNKRGGPSVKPIVHLDWLATVKLTEVDKSGSPLRLLESRSRRLTRVPGGGIAVDFAGRLGFYRLDLVIRNRKGRVFGKFGEYFRVLAAKTDGRLALDAATYAPGGTVSACLENSGTTTLSSGGRAIEVFDGATWSRSPIDPPSSTALPAYLLGPGEALSVGAFALPVDAPAGRYRWTWSGQVLYGPVPYAPLQLSSEFVISAGS